MLPKGLLKEYGRTLSMMIRIMDMLIIFCAGWFAYVVKFGEYQIQPAYLTAMVVGIFFVPVVFSFFNIYFSVRAKGLIHHFTHLLQAICALSLMLAGLAFFTKSGQEYSRAWFGIWLVCAFLLLVLYRCTILLFLRFMRTRGLNERRVVIFGAGVLGVKFAETVQQALWTGFRITAFIDDQAASKPNMIHNIPVIQTPENLSEFLVEEGVDELWLALPLRAESRVRKILHNLRHQTITMRFVLDIFGLDLLNHSIADIAGFPVLNISTSPMMGMNRVIKAVEDRILAAFILLFISPVLLILATAVKISSPGPIFFRQKRVGWNGHEFEMLKFRTMPVNAESETGPVWATKEDARPTKIGKFMRRTSLDELPQFINVLKGDMSIVGPRPERKVFVDEFKENIPSYMQKHLVKAGITGWAQVNGWRGNTSLEKRIEYDLHYIKYWSLMFDIKIIFLTIFRGFISRNAY